MIVDLHVNTGVPSPGAMGKHRRSNPSLAGSIPFAKVSVVPPWNPGTTELGL